MQLRVSSLTVNSLCLLISMLLLTSGRTNDPKLPGSLQFEIRNAGITVKGHFREWQHEVRFDPSNLSGSSLEGKAVVASVATGIENRDEHLQTRQYFHAAVHPYIVMRSRNLQHKGGNRYEGNFDIRIRDITRAVTMVFTADRLGKGWRLRGTCRINRMDFGVGGKSLILGDEVRILIDATSTYEN